MIPTLPDTVCEEVVLNDVGSSKAIIKIETSPRAVEVDVACEMRLRSNRLEPHGGLFLPDPEFSHHISNDLCSSRLLPVSAIGTNWPVKLLGAFFVEALSS